MNPFIYSQRPGSMVGVFLVQRLLDEHKESDPLNDLNNFRFDNYYLKQVIMDDNVQLVEQK